MGRHRRSSTVMTVDARHRRVDPRPAVRQTVRPRHESVHRSLLGVSATMVVGAAAAAAVSAGLLPVDSGLSDGLPYTGRALGTGDGTAGGLTQPDGSPSSPVAPGTDGGNPTIPQDGGGTPSTASAPASRPSATAPQRSAPRPAPTTTATAPPSPAPSRTAVAASPAPTAEVAAAADQMLALVNEARTQAGCRPLIPATQFDRLAQDFSDEMAVRGFFGHTDPDGKSPWDRATSLGITGLGGENIARGQADARGAMAAWMDSPDHRANVVDCDYRTIGIGVHVGDGGPWWTQDFGF